MTANSKPQPAGESSSALLSDQNSPDQNLPDENLSADHLSPDGSADNFPPDHLPPGYFPPDERLLRYRQSLAHGRQIKAVIPGGVDSPFRAFHEVGGEAIFFTSAKGSKLTDIDGNVYIDYLGAWGPAILGHAPAKVVQACQSAVADSAVFGAPHTFELSLAKKMIEALPSVESVRFVSSGTEAVMTAVRLARGFTGRETLLMFEGGYHGHSDAVLASTTHQSSSGIPQGARSATVLAEYNNLRSVEALLEEHRGKIAAVLVEPVCGSMGVVAPHPDFHAGLRALCDRYETLLIFDEVITGFRVAYGGAQVLYDIKPDLSCFGKALGGGMPIGAYGGRKEIMDKLLPSGDVYQAGTFSGNPVTMAGGIATLDSLREAGVYETLEARADQLFCGLAPFIAKREIPVQLARVGSMFGLVFAPHPVHNYKQSLAIDTKAFARYFHYMLDQGIYLPPSGQDAACISLAHSEADIEETIPKCRKALEFAFHL